MNSLILYPFQEHILNQTIGRDHVAYFCDMGLGKTFIGAEKIKQLDNWLNLVVCQKSKINDWVEHFENFYPEFEVFDLTKNLDVFMHTYEFYTKPIIGVVNYDLIFRREAFLILEDFTLLLDESSLIQNERARRTNFILKMKPKNIILLSGTPTGGKYENLWSQLHLLGWSISNKAYEQNYVNWKKIEVGGFPIRIVDKSNPYKNVDRLKKKLREHGAVFLKTEEVFDLPEQTIIEINISKSKEYEWFRNRRLITVDGKELVGDDPLSFRLYSRMLCGHYNEEKLTAFRDILQSTNDRLIVFYNFNAELEKLMVIIEGLEKPISIVNGLIKDLEAYENHDDSVTLVQYQAGAMGLNLQKANKIIYFTPTDKSELFEQSKKRIHRIGQERPCFYYLLVCKNTVEDEEIFPLLGLRKRLTDDLFKGGSI